MRLRKVSKRSIYWKGKNIIPVFFVFVVISVGLMFYLVNVRLTPIYLQYAEVQSKKIASLVVSKAINSRTADLMNATDIIVEVPSESPGTVTTQFNTEIINRVQADIITLVQTQLEQAEKGNLANLPYLDDIEYDPDAMEDNGGIVFLVPLGQATNIPLLGNLGPKIPIRFHVIGNLQSNVVYDIREFGINNAMIDVSVVITVNVQVIVPLATKATVIEQKIPVALGIISSPVPQIYTKGSGANAPQVEVPYQPPSAP
ncbi:sporulation protein YunB [Paenisporosarcina sp. TG-14]|uniref:sporulation protein YunB n=1 Tax=Paenisporosarcina sp. TG-14 TaxID=1231057 RepID=UPI00031F4F0A|nr:sporulation protein YunB [Paenisporosarcina sp. TG-14]